MVGVQNRVAEKLTHLCLILYMIPSIGILLAPSIPFENIGWVLALLGGGGYLILARNPWEPFDKPGIPKEDLSDEDIDILLVEYEELSEMYRYKDLLMIRSVYLSLAVSGVLATVITQTNRGQAFVAMVGSLITFAFVISITSQKGARDQVNERKNELEEHPRFENMLTSVKSGVIRERPFFSGYSASEYILNLHRITFVLWTGTYLYLVS